MSLTTSQKIERINNLTEIAYRLHNTGDADDQARNIALMVMRLLTQFTGCRTKASNAKRIIERACEDVLSSC